MKKIFYYLTVLFISLWTFNGCKKMDSSYKQFIVPGGITYTGKANSAMAYAGRSRVKISWLNGADPNITKSMIFWNNYADSVMVNIPPTGDTISVIISNLPEKNYSFMIKNYNAKGISSIPVEILGGSYGARYQSQLLNRFVKSSFIDVTGQFSIQWGTADISTGAIATEVKYTDAAGILHIQKFNITDSESKILDYKPGTTFQYRTLYIPKELSIDTFYTDFMDQYVSKKIDKSNWTATADSYTPTGLLPNGPPKKAIDDNINTFWHTLYPSNVTYPHWLAVDMKQVINVSSVELTYRQNVFNGFDDFMIQGSLDGVNWTTYGSFTILKINDPQSFPITGTPKIRYIRVYAEKGANNYAHLAEFSVLGY